jgi:hypothetical protein
MGKVMAKKRVSGWNIGRKQQQSRIISLLDWKTFPLLVEEQL